MATQKNTNKGTYVTTSLRRLGVYAIILCALTAIITALIVTSIPSANYPAKYRDTVERNNLMNRVNAGDKEAIDEYFDTCIVNDCYFRDGPVTFELMAKRYNVSADKLMEAYESSDYDSAQEFFNKYMTQLINSGDLSELR